ncbi:MAG: hypothetical protein QOF33_342 [Thermomicrobiales bacterium]|nr:hypothetical protein [Thermomicrobiales bacterium]MEA2594081.1 hypothetical protein [Thermomicrobiales bacterium]
MNILTFHNTKRRALTFVGAAALSLTMVVPALAADATTATVTGGALSITNPLVADFAGRGITGVAQTTTAALDTFSVSDLTGTGAGWHVIAQASTFTTGTKTLAVGSLSTPALTATANGTTSAGPTMAAGPYTLDNGPLQIASAALTAGMGTYDFSASTLTLALPADVFAGAYASTVTISVVTAP